MFSHDNIFAMIIYHILTIFLRRFAIYSKKSDSSKRNGNERFAAGVRKFIIAPPLYVCRMKLNIKSEVESYLEKTFYNLSTIDLNDCNNYNEMRSIANERYGLNITDPFLPDGSLEQGLDFIDILRDLECKFICVCVDETCRDVD